MLIIEVTCGFGLCKNTDENSDTLSQSDGGRRVKRSVYAKNSTTSEVFDHTNDTT